MPSPQSAEASFPTFPAAGTVMDGATFDAYLRPAELIDSDHPAIIDYAEDIVGAVNDPIEKAVRLYYAVRDQGRYDPYGSPLKPEAYVASNVLAQRHGFCINKAGLMAAVARAAGIPARVGYADVRNHMTTKKLSERMGTDMFYFHGYTDLWLGDAWVKCTPAFNIELTTKFRLKPLDFDGIRGRLTLKAPTPGPILAMAGVTGNFDASLDLAGDFQHLGDLWKLNEAAGKRWQPWEARPWRSFRRVA